MSISIISSVVKPIEQHLDQKIWFRIFSGNPRAASQRRTTEAIRYLDLLLQPPTIRYIILAITFFLFIRGLKVEDWQNGFIRRCKMVAEIRIMLWINYCDCCDCCIYLHTHSKILFWNTTIFNCEFSFHSYLPNIFSYIDPNGYHNLISFRHHILLRRRRELSSKEPALFLPTKPINVGDHLPRTPYSKSLAIISTRWRGELVGDFGASHLQRRLDLRWQSEEKCWGSYFDISPNCGALDRSSVLWQGILETIKN